VSNDITKVSPKEAFEQTGQAVMTAVAELVKLHPEVASNPAAQAFMAVFGPVMGLALGRGAYGVIANRVPRLAAGYRKAFKDDAKKVEEHAKANEDNPDYHEVMYRSFRQMMDAADPEVIEALGYMAGQYAYGCEKPDSYFRRLGRLLCDLEAIELDQLRPMLRNILSRKSEVKALGVSLGLEKVRVGEEDGKEIVQTVLAIDLEAAPSLPVGSYPSASHLMFLLKRERFAIEAQGTWDESEGDPHAASRMWISFAVVRQILGSIDPQPIT
jgi:hypothetical protein